MVDIFTRVTYRSTVIRCCLYQTFSDRSVEVFYRDGYKMSELLEEQHKETGLYAVSGPLRFSDICVIWIQCKQEGS